MQFGHADSDVEANKEGSPYSEMPTPDPSGGRGHTNKNPSWDLLAGYRKFEHSYEEFDTRKASEKHLVFADGDVPNTAVSGILPRTVLLISRSPNSSFDFTTIF